MGGRPTRGGSDRDPWGVDEHGGSTEMIEIKLFGVTTVVTDAGQVSTVDLGGAKPRQILEILATSNRCPVSKERLAELLWDSEPPRSYVGTLESYVCLLRRRLGLGMGRTSLLATTPHGYLLDPSIRIDVVELRALAQGLAAVAPAERVARAVRAMSLVSGELLASSPYAAWADQERSVVDNEIFLLCHQGAAAALEIGDHDAAALLAGAVLGRDPIAESAALQLMKALAGSGRRAEALRVYLDLREALDERLGMEPSGAAQGLYLELLRADQVPCQRSADHDELKTLLDALRATLEKLPGVTVPAEDAALAAAAVRVLNAA